jgi:uncharacterized protein (TIGR03437 family)
MWQFFLSLLAITFALLAQTPPPHYAWNGDKVHEIRLRFAQPDYWTRLTNNYFGTEQDAVYLEASLEWGPYKFSSVGVRFKGNSSYRGATTRKKPFRIKLNEFVKGQKIDGIGAFNLSNGWNDPSLIREHLYYEMARSLGLKAPRVNFAVLYINDEYMGLYILGEVVNSDFLQNYFGKKESTGNLYKANIGASFGYLGTDKAAYKQVWEKQTNEEADDWSDLIELCNIINTYSGAELRTRLESLMDIDSVLTALALDNATVNLDSYVGMGQNFNIYRRPSDKRWVWIVWDPSLAFGAFSQGVTNAAQLPLEYTQSTSGGGGAASAGRPLATKLWAIPEYKERYRQIYKSIVEKIYNPSSLSARAQALRSVIDPYAKADTQLLVTQTQYDNALTAPLTTPAMGGGPGGGGMGVGNVPGLITLINARTEWLKTQFATQTFSTATLSSATSRLNFSMATGASNPAAQTVSLTFTGVNTPPTFSAYATTDTGGNWLTLNITGGPIPGSFDVSVDGKSLATGVYTGNIKLFLGAADPIHIPVSLTVGTLAPPSVSAIVNAASYANNPVTPGEIVTIFGSNLGGSTTAGVSVTFDGAAATLIYVTPSQMALSVPLSVAGKSQTTVRVTYGGQTSADFTKAVTEVDPALFTWNAAGTGPAAVINQSGAVNSSAAAAPRGSTVAFYLTGAGLTNSSGAIIASTTVKIGGQDATVTYAGVSPGAVLGLYQVNATVPAGVPAGAQPVVITVGGVSSPAGVTVYVQ